ncbi:glutathione synthase [Cesiribacter sp. SM1]|uniref:glutathione synthase n=1 Tax=Cesiribacter sp. SM1 TaxID=2861196 RepID=UPI001CD4CE10|nr:glutathione synthase [Cesiribacter sp. SM1]
MKILFVLDDVATEYERNTSVLMAHHMHNKGHEVFLSDVRAMAYQATGNMGAHAYIAPKKNYKTQEEYIQDITGNIKKKAEPVMVSGAELDVIFIRNDPSKQQGQQWAQTAGAVFGQVATQEGVIVLNDPFTLSDSVNKMYFQQFPEDVRPRTVITRDPKEIKDFYQQQKKQGVVMKPLQGSGGQGVFLVNEKNEANLNSMIEANLRDGYIIVQEYLPEAAEGDIRLFMLNGQIFESEGKIAAMHRFNDSGDARSNVSAGGKIKKAKMTAEVRELADKVRPKLVQDGVFLCGLDIAGKKLMETNIFSPGGLTDINIMLEYDFAAPLTESIERKVEYRRVYGNRLSNKLLNTL